MATEEFGWGDDPTIHKEAELWRRIPPWDDYIVYDQRQERWRPSSMAFEDDADGQPMSVFLAAETPGPDTVLAGHAEYGLTSITAGLARECQQGIARDPLPDQPAHAVVFGKKTSSVKRRLARESKWVVPPPVK